MKSYSTLHELVEKDARSKALYHQLSADVQVALQEQRQNIRTFEELCKAAEAFEKRSRG